MATKKFNSVIMNSSSQKHENLDFKVVPEVNFIKKLPQTLIFVYKNELRYAADTRNIKLGKLNIKCVCKHKGNNIEANLWT